jgi:hypothetical protein
MPEFSNVELVGWLVVIEARLAWCERTLSVLFYLESRQGYSEGKSAQYSLHRYDFVAVAAGGFGAAHMTS